ncbi:hypothetical protein H5410_063176 [Solanum commersonii]|uniref:Uncharacterized protein n=1 Tax=Solanum commersonii TaxID=4109 RepID=A0A9J5WCU3_SOLCO|nr:hypothetical protein H5410_063176 [Solanum commersonii]
MKILFKVLCIVVYTKKHVMVNTIQHLELFDLVLYLSIVITKYRWYIEDYSRTRCS